MYCIIIVVGVKSVKRSFGSLSQEYHEVPWKTWFWNSAGWAVSVRMLSLWPLRAGIAALHCDHF